MNQWEYCEVTIGDANLDKLSMYTYRAIKTQVTENKFRGNTEARENQRRLLAKLGTEGWEIVSIQQNTVYLKRPVGGSTAQATASAQASSFFEDTPARPAPPIQNQGAGTLRPSTSSPFGDYNPDEDDEPPPPSGRPPFPTRR